MLNWTGGQTRANSAYIQLGDGSIDLFSSATADFIVDVTGYFVPAESASAGRFVAVDQRRIADTRNGTRPGAGATTLVALPTSIPVDATAVVVTLTATANDRAGFYTVSAAGQPHPLASAMNVDAPWQTRAATVTVARSASGVQVYSSASSHVIVDVLGYFTGASATQGSDGLFIPQTPVRLVDTRSQAATGDNRWSVRSANGGEAMALSLTAVNAAASGWATMYPAGLNDPGTSTINFAAGEVVANLAIGDASSVISASSKVDVIVDQYGTFR